MKQAQSDRSNRVGLTVGRHGVAMWARRTMMVSG